MLFPAFFFFFFVVVISPLICSFGKLSKPSRLRIAGRLCVFSNAPGSWGGSGRGHSIILTSIPGRTILFQSDGRMRDPSTATRSKRPCETSSLNSSIGKNAWMISWCMLYQLWHSFTGKLYLRPIASLKCTASLEVALDTVYGVEAPEVTPISSWSIQYRAMCSCLSKDLWKCS